MRDVPLSAWLIVWFFFWELLSPFTCWFLILLADVLFRRVRGMPPASFRARIGFGLIGLCVSLPLIKLGSGALASPTELKAMSSEIFWGIVLVYALALAISAWKLKGLSRALGVTATIVIYVTFVIQNEVFERSEKAAVTWRPARPDELWEHDRTLAKHPVTLMFIERPKLGQVVLYDPIHTHLSTHPAATNVEAEFVLSYTWGYLHSYRVVSVDGIPVPMFHSGLMIGSEPGIQMTTPFKPRWLRAIGLGVPY